jgi:hypothetical protein
MKGQGRYGPDPQLPVEAVKPTTLFDVDDLLLIYTQPPHE